MEDEYNIFPPVGATFKKLMELERFNEMVTQSVPVYALKECGPLLAEMRRALIPATVKLWFAAITLSLSKVEEDCQQAHVGLNQDEKDKITYFANKVIKAFATKPHVPIIMSELLKDHYGIDFSDLEDQEEKYEKMLGIIDEAVETKGC